MRGRVTTSDASGAFHEAAPMSSGRLQHSATLLGDGRVLVAGGSILSGSISRAEIYEPVAAQ